MIIEIADTILAVDRTLPVVRQVLETVGIAVWRGQHAVLASRDALRAIIAIEGLTAESRDTYEKLLNNYSVEAHFLRSISRKLLICPLLERPVRLESNWHLPYNYLLDGISPTVLLAENLTDANLYSFCAQQYIVHNQLGRVTCQLALRGGGGSTTVDEVASIMQSRREFAICITDSDRVFPEMAMGIVAAQCAAAVRDTVWVVDHMCVNGRMLENILPTKFVEMTLPAEYQESWRKYVALADIVPQATQFANLKNGLKMKTFESMPKGGHERLFWENTLAKLGAVKRCKDCDDCTQSDSCINYVIPPLGERIGTRVLEYLKANSHHHAVKNGKNSKNFSDWLILGKNIFEMGFAAKARRI